MTPSTVRRGVLPLLICSPYFFLFFFTDPATTEIYTLSLHDALPIYRRRRPMSIQVLNISRRQPSVDGQVRAMHAALDRKSTRLNSSHVSISYAVFCLKKKNCHKA